MYFYDVGLASYLLGIESELHVSRDPLRGNLFENMVVMEALKFRLHRGRRSNMHFYRDSNGKEVDLFLAYGSDIFPIEVKSGMTINNDYFKSLRSLGREINFPLGAGLIYGGDMAQERHGVAVHPIHDLHKLLASKLEG